MIKRPHLGAGGCAAVMCLAVLAGACLLADTHYSGMVCYQGHWVNIGTPELAMVSGYPVGTTCPSPLA